MSEHDSDLKAAIEASYRPTDSTDFADESLERALTNVSSCYVTMYPDGSPCTGW